MTADAFARAAANRHKPKRNQSTTLTVRLTHEERNRLDQLAGNRPVSAFVRSRLFGKGGARKTNARRMRPDTAALARVLAALGRSHLSSDLNALVWANDEGKLVLDPISLKLVRLACADVASMRRDLVEALGLHSR